MRGTDDYKTEAEYEAIFADRIDSMNKLFSMKEHKFALDYAYGGVRLVKRKNDTGGEADLSTRFFYDEEGTADYDAFMELLNTAINVLRIAKEKNYA